MANMSDVDIVVFPVESLICLMRLHLCWWIYLQQQIGFDWFLVAQLPSNKKKATKIVKCIYLIKGEIYNHAKLL